MNKMQNNTIPAVEKTVAILNCLGNRNGGATQAELAAELDITPSTCYRILQTLLAADFVRKGAGGRYDLSNGLAPVVHKLSDFTARFSVVQPVLDRLAAETGLCCKLSIRQGRDQVSILRAESPRPMAVSGKIGVHFPIVEGSVGAALLADASPGEIRELAASCTVPVAEQNHAELVLAGVEAIRRHGYCFNAGKNRWRVDALSVPVRDMEGNVIAALTLLGSDADFTGDQEQALASAVRRAARECAKLCG